MSNIRYLWVIKYVNQLQNKNYPKNPRLQQSPGHGKVNPKKKLRSRINVRGYEQVDG